MIVPKKSIKAAYHIPASDDNPQPVTVLFWDIYSHEIHDPKMNIYHYVALVILKPDAVPEVE